MRIERTDSGVTRREIRPGVEEEVRSILEEVRTGGDEAVLRLTERFDKAELGPEQLRVDARELEGSVGVLEPEVLSGLRTAIANVRAVVRAQAREPVEVDLDQGQHLEIVEVPVGRAAIYVPGGRAPYPSTVVMGAVTAQVAGVEEIVVCSPPREESDVDPTVLAACALCGVDEVYRMGGAQAVAALALGTEGVPRVDVIAGPGNVWVQEAKRQLSGVVGIDSFAGPTELAVVFSEGADPTLVALDLRAQAEHGPDSRIVGLSPSAELAAAVATAVEGSGCEVRKASLEEALAFVEEMAPEHLQLVGPD